MNFVNLAPKFEEQFSSLTCQCNYFPNKKEIGRRRAYGALTNARRTKISGRRVYRPCRSVSLSLLLLLLRNSVRSAFSDRLNPETSPRIKGNQAWREQRRRKKTRKKREGDGAGTERVSSRLSRDWKFRLRRDFDLNLYETGRKVWLLVHRKCDLHACGPPSRF